MDADEGCIVDSGVVDGAFHQNFGSLAGREFGGKGVCKVSLPKAVNEAVRADQETIPWLIGHCRKMRADGSMTRADDFVESGTPGVAAVLDLGDFPSFPLGPCPAVIAG